MPGSALTTGGLDVDQGSLSILERSGSNVTFNDPNQISNGSTLTAAAFGGAGAYIVNGMMSIDGTSTVNMDDAAAIGTGTIH